MPRPSYPSDHRRWFRVCEDILDDTRLAALGLADQMLYIRLLATLNRQKSRDGIGRLSLRAATALADRERWAYAEPAYSRLVAGGLVALSHLGGGIEYRVDKWPEHQGFTTSILRRDSDTTPPPTPTHTPKKKNPSLSPLSGETKQKPRTGKSEAPDDLSAEQKVALLAWVRAKHPSEEARIREHVDAALDYHRARGNRMTSWELACRTWIRNAVRFDRTTNGARAKQEDRAALMAENIQAAMRLAEEREARERERKSGNHGSTDPHVRRLPAVRDPLPH